MIVVIVLLTWCVGVPVVALSLISYFLWIDRQRRRRAVPRPNPRVVQ